MIVAIVALVLAHIGLRDRIEVLEAALDRLEEEKKQRGSLRLTESMRIKESKPQISRMDTNE